MVDADAVILDELGRLAPRDGVAGCDWADVLRRANVQRRGSVLHRPRRLFIAVALTAAIAIAVAVSPLGATIGREVGNFSDWLTGQPGKPASSSAQKAFANATRSWFEFPKPPELRELITSKQGGVTVKVFGFRSSSALCLRIVAGGVQSTADLTCAPLSELRARKTPALVLASDYGVGRGAKVFDGPIETWVPHEAITVGVVADGIKHVIVGRSDGSESEATVHGDAFLSSVLHPGPELRVDHVWAVENGTRVSIPFAPAFTPLHWFSTVTRKPSGPSKVMRPLHTGAISWFAHHQLRGQPVPKQLRHVGLLGASSKVIFARMVTPDPKAAERVVISLLPAGKRFFGGRLRDNKELCAEVVGGVISGGRIGSGGCWPAGRLFSTGPFTETVEQGVNNQYVTIVGVASDDVAHLRLYLSSGAYVPLALNSNAYFGYAALSDYPLRLVGYDRSDRVVGITTLSGGRQPPFPMDTPKQGAVWRTVIRNNAGLAMTAPASKGGLCVGFRLADGSGSIDCSARPAANMIAMGFAVEDGGLGVNGRTGSAITRVVIQFRNGRQASIKPMRGIVLGFIPHVPIGSLSAISGFNHAGKAVAVERAR
jgi:hypothetical protein